MNTVNYWPNYFPVDESHPSPGINRADRRAKRKAKNKIVIRSREPGKSWNERLAAFHERLSRANATQSGDEDVATLLTSPYAQLDRLSFGTLDTLGFVDLSEANCAAALLVKKLLACAANNATRAVLEPLKPAFKAAADALTTIGNRNHAIGRYVAKADELASLRESLIQYEALIRVSDRAHVVHAQLEAQELVTAKLRERLALPSIQF